MTHAPEPQRQAAPGRPWLKVAIATVFVGGIAAFFALDGQRYLSLDAVKSNRDALLAFADRHFAAALAIAFVVYAGTVALSLPGGLVLSLAVGFVFGRWVGTALVVVAATVGATLVFLAARYLFADAARRRLGAPSTSSRPRAAARTGRAIRTRAACPATPGPAASRCGRAPGRGSRRRTCPGRFRWPSPARRCAAGRR